MCLIMRSHSQCTHAPPLVMQLSLVQGTGDCGVSAAGASVAHDGAQGLVIVIDCRQVTDHEAQARAAFGGWQLTLALLPVQDNTSLLAAWSAVLRPADGSRPFSVVAVIGTHGDAGSSGQAVKSAMHTWSVRHGGEYIEVDPATPLAGAKQCDTQVRSCGHMPLCTHREICPHDRW